MNEEGEDLLLKKAFEKEVTKVTENLKLIKLYFLLWSISVIPNFFYLTGDLGVMIYHIADTTHPLVIIILIIRAVSIGL